MNSCVENLHSMLQKAHTSGYAVGSFSPRYTKMIRPIIEAAMQTQSPAIVQISEKEITRHQVSLDAFAQEFYHVVECLYPQVPLALHLDHTTDVSVIHKAISCGFTSVMIDASSMSFDKNIAITQKVVEFAHAKGVTIEAELGQIGTTDFVETNSNIEAFTIPEEAKIFCESTHVDALAVSVGTAHGIYRTKQPHIEYDILREINSLVDTPLVLHGGSGVPSSMVTHAVTMSTGGVSKVNVATDLEQAMLKVLQKEEHLTDAELDSYTHREIEQAEEAVRNMVKEKIVHYLLSNNKTC